MSGSSGGFIAPQYSYAIPWLGPLARGVSAAVVLAAGASQCTISLANLLPGQLLGNIGSIYVDNSQCPFPVLLSFQDTGAAMTVPANKQGFFFGLTGGKQVILSATAADGIHTTTLQILNTLLSPAAVVL